MKIYRHGTDFPLKPKSSWGAVEFYARNTTKSAEELEKQNRPRRNPVRSGNVVRTSKGRKFEPVSTVKSVSVCYNADASVRRVVVRRRRVNENVVTWNL